MDDIAARGRLPIVVGGTGLYLDALVPAGNLPPAARTHPCAGHCRRAGKRRVSKPSMQSSRASTPPRRERLHLKDEKRILRALEIYYETGRTMTEHTPWTKTQPPALPGGIHRPGL